MDIQKLLSIVTKKRLIIAIAIVFLAFVIFGFWAASRLDSRWMGNLKPGKTAETQRNYLLVQVNDLEERSPAVISIWVVFIDRSDASHLVFMPLFPNADLKINAKIARQIKVKRDGVLIDRSIRKIENRYNINTNGYVLLDNTAISSIARDLFDESPTPMVETPHEAEMIAKVLAKGNDNFFTFCAEIQTQSNGNILDRINWGQLIPGHFATNLSFEELTLELKSLKPAGQIQTCEVIDN